MRRSQIIVIILVLLLSGLLTFGRVASAAGPAGEWTGNFNLFVGQKSLDEDDWAPVEDQLEVGVEVDFRQKAWPVNIAVDFLYSSDEADLFPGIEAEGKTWELDLGVRKIWDNFGIVHPFIGGGLAIVNGEVEVMGFSDDDTGLGFWLDGGVKFAVTPNFNVGLEIRYSKADVTIAGVDADAGGWHIGGLVGYHW